MLIFSPPQYVVRANRIESLSLTREGEDALLGGGGLYDSSESDTEELSAPLDFSSNRLVIE